MTDKTQHFKKLFENIRFGQWHHHAKWCASSSDGDMSTDDIFVSPISPAEYK